MALSHRIFIDGNHGTTGLELTSSLDYSKYQVLEIAEEKRKDIVGKVEIALAAEVVVLCLPDDAAREMALTLDRRGYKGKILDTSTAHRVDDDWVYGYPELPGRREEVRKAQKVANPGCYAIGLITLLKPLIDGGWLNTETPVIASAVSGYSGGGREMIEKYEENLSGEWKRGEDRRDQRQFNPYAMELDHKHLQEIKKQSGVEHVWFQPSVIGVYRGMVINVMFHQTSLQKKIRLGEVEELYKTYFANKRGIVVDRLSQGSGQNKELLIDGKFLNPVATSNSNQIEVIVGGNDQVVNLFAQLDNLGKGAAGNALQNLDIMTGS